LLNQESPDERAVNPQENFKTNFLFAFFNKVIQTKQTNKKYNKNSGSRPTPNQLDDHNSNFVLLYNIKIIQKER